ncbi:uncharacterized protein LOC113211782 [Frankliniella occidentalis]|uniref:Uncharacterized protein LOC113211782 n=1 Tax=Frankliniella occidentalis TaxID=133901 RepID=A0A6J1SYM5_FRAOC|nr:uncharacterized protein LOC113211782 [Frankliniella occidentalis]
MFGSPMKVGLRSKFPSGAVDDLQTEEELQDFLRVMHFGNADSPMTCGETCSAHEGCSECGTGLHPHCPRGGKCGNCSRAAAVLEVRSTARKDLQEQAQTMQKISDVKLPPASVGDTTTVYVPKADRGRGDPRNVVAVVLEATEDGFYKLGNNDGVPASMYARNHFDVFKEKFVSTEVVPESEHTFRTAATKGSILGGQGFHKQARPSAKRSCQLDFAAPTTP